MKRQSILVSVLHDPIQPNYVTVYDNAIRMKLSVSYTLDHPVVGYIVHIGQPYTKVANIVDIK